MYVAQRSRLCEVARSAQPIGTVFANALVTLPAHCYSFYSFHSQSIIITKTVTKRNLGAATEGSGTA
jgi:hypothetical protein